MTPEEFLKNSGKGGRAFRARADAQPSAASAAPPDEQTPPRSEPAEQRPQSRTKPTSEAEAVLRVLGLRKLTDRGADLEEPSLAVDPEPEDQNLDEGTDMPTTDNNPPARRREPVQPAPAPQPGGSTVVCGRCGGRYLDDPDGHQAHRTVFGHAPAPAPEGTR